MCLDIDHCLWFGSYSLLANGTIYYNRYGLWTDRGLETRARYSLIGMLLTKKCCRLFLYEHNLPNSSNSQQDQRDPTVTPIFASTIEGTLPAISNVRMHLLAAVYLVLTSGEYIVGIL